MASGDRGGAYLARRNVTAYMANVLPPHEREALRRNYYLRVVVVLTFMFAAAMLIGSVALVPAYLTARTDLGEIKRLQDVQASMPEAVERDAAIETARVVNAQTELLSRSNDRNATRAVEHVMRDWQSHADHIIISEFVYEAGKGEAAKHNLRISGEARDRASLNAFVQTLRANSAFTGVTLPVSDLASGAILPFSLTLQFVVSS